MRPKMLIPEFCRKREGGGGTEMKSIKPFLEEAAVPIIGGIIGSFIGMGIAALLGIL